MELYFELICFQTKSTEETSKKNESNPEYQEECTSICSCKEQSHVAKAKMSLRLLQTKSINKYVSRTQKY